MWKQGTQKKYTIQACRDAFTKAKTQLKLNLLQDGKGNRKGFSKYIGDERKAMGNNVRPLLNETGNLASQDREKMRVNVFFCLSLC